MAHRMAPIVIPVYLAGLASVLLAAYSFATEPHTASMLLGVAALLAASTLASRYPVPIEGPNSGGVSLSFVFAASAIVLFGWAAGVLVAFAAPVLIQLSEHRPPIRIAYNGSVFACAAAVGGFLVSFIPGDGIDALVAKVGVSAFTQYTINLALISLVVAVTSRRPFFELIRASLRWTIMIFALMASAALVLVVLWQRSPLLSAALVGPLLAIALYQRSTYRALRAMKLALTDPLTGLGNHRHFHDRLERELIEAERKGCSFSLCLIDVDDFKRVNDLFGHPAGDRVLSRLATTLRQNGEAFRLGGDEFALLLPQYDESRGGLDGGLDHRPDRPSRSRAHRLGHGLRRCRDLPAPGARSRRADPSRGQRPVLGEGERQEPRARLPPRRRRAGRAAQARHRPRPRRALPRRRQPREGGRPTGHLHR